MENSIRSKSILLFFVMILLTSCAAPTPQPTATAVPTSTRPPVPIPTATQTLKPPSDSDVSWIQNGDELFIFDLTSNEWIRAAQVSDTYLPVYEANGKKIILVGDEWLAVTIEAGTDGKLTAVTEDGIRMRWDEGGWEKYVTHEIATMAQFERQNYWEQGAVIEVADLYGAGPATIAVEKITEAEPGQVLEYQELDFLNQPSIDFDGKMLSAFTLMNLTVEATSLLRVDIEDNAQVADGTLCLMRLGTLIQGKHTSFEIVIGGNMSTLSKDETGESRCNDWSVGRVIKQMRMDFFPAGGVGLEDLIAYKYSVDEPGDTAKILFDRLGEGSVPFNSAKILKAVREGGILDKSMVYVGLVR